MPLTQLLYPCLQRAVSGRYLRTHCVGLSVKVVLVSM